MNVYTDGSCSPNPGKGGWGVWYSIPLSPSNKSLDGGDSLDGDELIYILNGGELNTTNNRMEMRAVYEALKLCRKSCTSSSEGVIIHTDSRYVIGQIGENVIDGKITGWLKGKNLNDEKSTVKNREMWLLIVNFIRSHKLTFRLNWIKGHTDTIKGMNVNRGNVEADKLANAGRLNI